MHNNNPEYSIFHDYVPAIGHNRILPQGERISSIWKINQVTDNIRLEGSYVNIPVGDYT